MAQGKKKGLSDKQNRKWEHVYRDVLQRTGSVKKAKMAANGVTRETMDRYLKRKREGNG